MKSNKFCTFYIVRHGETEWNKQKRIQGHENSELTQIGIAQAKKRAESFINIDFDAVFSSDLIRAVHTAELLMKNHQSHQELRKKLNWKTTALIRERYLGILQGKAAYKLRADLKELLNALFSDDYEKLSKLQKQNPKFADIENNEQLISRLLTFLRQTALAYPGKKVLVVSHGGVIYRLLKHLGTAGKNERLVIKNLAYFVLESDGVEFFVKDMEGIKVVPLVK